MALRLMEMVLGRGDEQALEALAAEFSVSIFWLEKAEDEALHAHLLLPTEKTEAVLDALEKRFSASREFKVVLLPVEASLPRLESAEDKPGPKAKDEAAPPLPGRISREELYADVLGPSRLTPVFVVMVLLSSVVAAIGVLRGNVPVIIGAMVIAPLLGPNVALALATALGDLSLGRTALRTSGAGVALALAVSTLLGLAVSFDPGLPEIAARTRVSLGDVALALASGCAGSLAFTTGLPATLIGVMVAVSLLPPLVTAGLLWGSGQAALGAGAILLFLTNIICVNLAGVVTFLVQGIRPRLWWEAERAKSATRIAIALWIFLLVVLVVIITQAPGG